MDGDDLIAPVDQVQNQNGQNVRAKRRRRYQNSLLPNAPRRPPTGYKMYIKNFFATNPREPGTNIKNLMTRAGEEWQALPPEQKEQFQNLCARDIAVYRDEMQMYNKQKKILKRPASTFAMFVSDFWKREKEAGPVNDGVTAVGKRARDAWAAASDETKAQYRQRYEVARQEYQTLITGILTGTVNLDQLVNGPPPAQFGATLPAATGAEPVAALPLDAAHAAPAAVGPLDGGGDHAHEVMEQ